ncbi:MAG: efflux RND transporter periplasmic adaptor subunit [Planctomycetes bacterium]|nr:efflux RND transporter periplasmic adaptor subunit [Planctomycetota bacterium]
MPDERGSRESEQTGRVAEPPPSPKPPKGPSLSLILGVLFAILIAFVAGGIMSGLIRSGYDIATQWIAFATGTGDEMSDAESVEPDELQFYTCGMHPWVILPKPGQCPICRMELTPLDPDKFSGEITIDPVVIQNIGVRVAEVRSGPVVRTIRTVGTVTYDETRVRDVNIKVPGWIEHLYVGYEGAKVVRGEPLFDFYSPDLYSAQSEYLTALKMRGKIGVDFVADSGLDAERLIDDARVQLEYFDITPEQIRALEASGSPSKTLTIRSPHTGVVIEKHANEGMRVDRGMRVYRIADLSKVWVMVSLYEYQLPLVQEGQRAIMTLPYIPGRTIEGTVIYIYPYLDERSRQATIRLEFDNPDLLLKPGMWTNIELKTTLARERTLVPRSAVIDTGERQVAFVSLGEGRFDPRDVLMGVEADGGQVEILEGLTPGEMVVTSGLFLLDSEARLRESMAKMIRGDLASEQEVVVAVAGASELRTLPAGVESGLIAVLESYFQIANRLSTDTTSGTEAPARRLIATLDELMAIEIPDAPHFWHEHEEATTVRDQAMALAATSDLEESRLLFADLSAALDKLIKATGIPPGFGTDVQELHCPMFLEEQGGSIWLQPAGDVRNPFMGAAMLECFDDRVTLPVTGSAQDIEPEDESDGSGAGPEREGALGPVAFDAPTQAAIDALIGAYLEIHDNLTRDDLAGMGGPIRTIRASLDSLDELSPAGLDVSLGRLHNASALDTESIESFRTGFQDLSDAVIELVRIAPPSDAVGGTIYQAYCPMVKANWLQRGEVVSNPYMTNMPTCGSIQQEFKVVSSPGGSP